LAAIPKLYDKTKETVELEQKLAQEQAILVWSAEAVRQIWNDFTAQIANEQLKNTYQQAQVNILDQPCRIHLKVSSPTAKEEISRNKDLLQNFQKRFAQPALFFEFEIVAPVVEAKSVLANNPAMLSLEEKRLLAEKMLIDENPLVADFKAAFGLRFKNK
jgi:hypothetical protein